MFSIPVQYFPFEYASRFPANLQAAHKEKENRQERSEESQPRREYLNQEEIMRALLSSFAGPFAGPFGERRYFDNEDSPSRNGIQEGKQSHLNTLETDLENHFVESKRQLQKDLERYSSELRSKLDVQLRKHALEAEQKLEQQLQIHAQEAFKSLEKSKAQAIESLRSFENREKKQVEERQKKQQEEEVARQKAEEKKKAEEERQREEALKRQAEEQKKVQEEKRQEALRRQEEVSALRRKEQEDACRKQEEAARKSQQEVANKETTNATNEKQTESDPISATVADNVVGRLLSGQFDDKTEAENFLSQLLFLASRISNRSTPTELSTTGLENGCRKCGGASSAGPCASCKSSAGEQCACDKDKDVGLSENLSERKAYQAIRKPGNGDDDEFVVLSTRI